MADRIYHRVAVLATAAPELQAAIDASDDFGRGNPQSEWADMFTVPFTDGGSVEYRICQGFLLPAQIAALDSLVAKNISLSTKETLGMIKRVSGDAGAVSVSAAVWGLRPKPLAGKTADIKPSLPASEAPAPVGMAAPQAPVPEVPAPQGMAPQAQPAAQPEIVKGIELMTPTIIQPVGQPEPVRGGRLFKFFGYINDIIWRLTRVAWFRLRSRPVPVSAYEMGKALLAGLPPGSAWQFADGDYMAVTLADAQKIISMIPLNRLKWVRDVNDCDDFARAFKVICSMVFRFTATAYVEQFSATSGHAYNVMVVADGETLRVLWLEPQLMTLFGPGSHPFFPEAGMKPLAKVEF